MSDLARQYAPGKELAVNTDSKLDKVAINGQELAVTQPPGKEKAIPGGDLAR